MKRTNFEKISNKAAKDAAIEDMKKSDVNHSYLFNQRLILNQPMVTKRLGLIGLV
jgi:hypothetical protein